MTPCAIVCWFSPVLFWSLVTPASAEGPSGRFAQVTVYDSARDELVTDGGYAQWFTNETWTLPLANPMAWLRSIDTPTEPASRKRHVAIYDPSAARMIVSGGARSSNVHE